MVDKLPESTRTQAYIDGSWVDAASGETFERISPATGSIFTQVAACADEDVDRAVTAARRSYEDGRWSQRTPQERKAVLLTFADLLETHRKEIAALDSIDAGKPIVECEDVDIPDAINNIRWYAEVVDKVFGKISPTGHEALGLAMREPIGVVGAVLPWNFPAATLSWKIGPALAAGNSLVVKPAELAPLSTLRIAELASEAGIPDGVFNVVPGLGHVAGRAIGLHQDIDALTFTGSTEVGRYFLKYAADSNLKQVTLECGGKSPQIVLGDNHDRLEQIADDLVEAAFWNAGQNCTAGSRVVVDNSIKADLVSLLAERAQARKVGDPSDRSTQMGPLIEAGALERTMSFIDDARAEGATIAAGGERLLTETGGYYVGATVVDNVSEQAAIGRQEIFAPVVSVHGFNDIEDGVRIANDTEYGLAATVWSHDIDRALGVARRVRAGTVAVNGYSEGDISTPFGGFRTSGFGGRDKGIEAFDQYTELKTIWVSLG